MIFDAKVEVLCDADGCGISTFVDLPFVYKSQLDRQGHYDHSDKAVERDLVRQEWVVRDGKHYCCEECSA